jgi:translation initiation factor IF-2
MNITDLARRLRVPTEELRARLPELGFDIGQKALKVPDREVGKIMRAWAEHKKRQYLNKKMQEQKARAERKKAVQEGTAEKVAIPEVITVREFSEILNMPIAKVMQELMRAGILASLNERIDFETASIIAEDLGFIAEQKDSAGEREADKGVDRLEEARKEEKSEDQQDRPPVIVIMGHVDHGKTRLLDTIRNTNVIDSEAGGITQHIGAYQVERKDQKLTFIDTPGHEAFTVMRSRGAKVADIAILVIAADDGIQPQTKEAIDIIKASGMPFIVAINKIDKESADVERIKGQLGEHNLIPEDWGGKTIVVPVSAKAGTNIDQLLDMLLLVRDMEKENIVANPERLALGTVIESHVDKNQGPVATVLVQTGTMKLGDGLGVRGYNYGKVRAMKAWNGENLTVAPPSTPVQILGLKGAPSVGDIIEVPENPKTLEKLKSQPGQKAGASEITVAASKQIETEDDDEKKVYLNIIIKSDVLGSLEALIGMFEKIDDPHVGVKIVGRGLGNVTDAEILQAEATKAFVAAFNVKPTKAAGQLARDKGVELKEYSVIYHLFEDIIEKLKELIPSEKVYTELGKVKILATFTKTAKGLVVGGRVLKGIAEIDATARVMRDEQVIGEGKIARLQSGRNDVNDVQQGAECGIEFEGKTKIEEGDVLDLYKEEVKKREFKFKF